ncbi:MAG: alpha/beta hydrolase [Pseudomonadota bacterium]
MALEDIKTVRVPPAPEIAVDVAGSGEVILFIHGIGGDRSNWSDQLLACPVGYQGVSVDLRGYGASDDFDGPFRYSDVCGDLLRVLEYLSAEQAHIVGLSMGGVVAMEFWKKAPERLKSLVLCDTGPGVANDRTPEDAQAFLDARQKPLLDGLSPSDIAPKLAKSLVSPKAPDRAYQRLVQSMSSLRKDTYLKSLEAMVMYRSPPDFTKIRTPTLIIVGEDDMLTPPAVSERMAEKIPNAKLVIVPEAGHLSNIEQPEAFNAALFAFLQATDDLSA